MPARDGTGPLGQGPVAGGRGLGRNIPVGRGRRGMGLGGSEVCECPKCGHKEPHKRGIPCIQVKCPKCGTPLRGEICK